MSRTSIVELETMNGIAYKYRDSVGNVYIRIINLETVKSISRMYDAFNKEIIWEKNDDYYHFMRDNFNEARLLLAHKRFNKGG